jgi:hypothetical protein
VPTVELPSPTDLLRQSLQRSIDLVSFGLQAAQAANPSELSLPDSLAQLAPAQNRSMDVATARTEFTVWVLANGFRDIVEALGPSLEWARRICFLWTRPGPVALHPNGRVKLQPSITEEEWNSQVVDGAPRFDRLSLQDKITYLEQEYGFVRPALTDAIMSLNAARNCLTHRAGMVGPRDLKGPYDEGLLVKIRKLHITVKGNDGTERSIDGPSMVNAGEQVVVGFIDSERLFRLGERIQFSQAEYIDVCMTFLAFALELQERIIAFQDRRRREASPDATS